MSNLKEIPLQQSAFRRMTSEGAGAATGSSAELARVQSLAQLRDPFETQEKFFEGLSSDLHHVVVKFVQPEGIPRKITELQALLKNADFSRNSIDATLAKQFYEFEAVMLTLLHWMQSLKPAYTSGGQWDSSVVQEQIFNSLASNYRQGQQAFNVITRIGSNSELERIASPRHTAKYILFYFGLALASAVTVTKAKTNHVKWTASALGAVTGALGTTKLLGWLLRSPECTSEEAVQDAYICLTCLAEAAREASAANGASSESVDATASAASPASKRTGSVAAASASSAGVTLRLRIPMLCTGCAQVCHKGHSTKFVGRKTFHCGCNDIGDCTIRPDDDDEEGEDAGSEPASPASGAASGAPSLPLGAKPTGVKFAEVMKQGERRDFVQVLIWCYHTALLELYTNREYVFTKPGFGSETKPSELGMYS